MSDAEDGGDTRVGGTIFYCESREWEKPQCLSV